MNGILHTQFFFYLMLFFRLEKYCINEINEQKKKYGSIFVFVRLSKSEVFFLPKSRLIFFFNRIWTVV